MHCSFDVSQSDKSLEMDVSYDEDGSPMDEGHGNSNRNNGDSGYDETPRTIKNKFFGKEKPSRLQEPSKMRNSDNTKEQDFDANPTLLYLALQRKNWESAAERIKDAPEETKVWISRKEMDGRLRWRLLPIHGAIVFKAPEYVVHDLLQEYPEGAMAKDDQGMLPLHLSFKVGSSEAIVTLLLNAFPESVNMKDRKGRTPQFLAETSNGPNKEGFLRALNRGISSHNNNNHLPAVASSSSLMGEQRAVLEARITQMKQQHKYEMEKLRKEADKKIASMEETIEALEGDLGKTQEASQVLVEHVTTLEGQINNRGDTERFLATKVASLDASLSAIKEAKEKSEKKLGDENIRLQVERDELKEKLNSLVGENEQHVIAIERASEILLTREKWEQTIMDQSEKIKQLTADCQKLRSDSAAMEETLNIKKENEHTLAQQVASLANQLAHVSERSNFTTTAFHSRVRELEQERETLRDTVAKLSKQLLKIANFLDEMTTEQQAIIEQAAAHEAEMAMHFVEHGKIVHEVKQSQIAFEETLKNQARISTMLMEYEKELEEKTAAQKAVMDAVESHSKHLEENRNKRQNLVLNVTSLKSQMQETKASVTIGLPSTMYQDGEEFVDQVIQHVMSNLSQDDLATDGAKVLSKLKGEDAALVKDANDFKNNPRSTPKSSSSLMSSSPIHAAPVTAIKINSSFNKPEHDEKVNAPTPRKSETIERLKAKLSAVGLRDNKPTDKRDARSVNTETRDDIDEQPQETVNHRNLVISLTESLHEEINLDENPSKSFGSYSNKQGSVKSSEMYTGEEKKEDEETSAFRSSISHVGDFEDEAVLP